MIIQHRELRSTAEELRTIVLISNLIKGIPVSNSLYELVVSGFEHRSTVLVSSPFLESMQCDAMLRLFRM